MPSYDYPRPALTTDVVLLRWRGGWLEVLLIRRDRDPFAGHHALPGGFVDAGENPRQGALRELLEETGVGEVPLYEVGAFGDPGRDPRGWVVSSAWLGLAPPDVRATAGDDARSVGWHRLAELPPLAFDHGAIIAAARRRLRALTGLGTEPMQLLPETFRTRQARHLYAQIRDEAIQPSAFKAWLRRRQAVERVGPSRFRRRPALRPDWLR